MNHSNNHDHDDNHDDDFWARRYAPYDGLSVAEALRRGWVTTDECAALLHLSPSRVRQLARDEVRARRPDLWLPCKRVGGRTLYFREDVEAYARRDRKPGWVKGRPKRALPW